MCMPLECSARTISKLNTSCVLSLRLQKDKLHTSTQSSKRSVGVSTQPVSGISFTVTLNSELYLSHVGSTLLLVYYIACIL